MTTNQNATHMADANNSNVEKNAKFKVEYYYSNGFGETSDESEWNTDINGLRERFSTDIFEYIERWLKGDDIKVQGEISEDVFLIIETTSYGTLMIKFTERYRAGGDNDPVYRYNDDVYLIEILEE